MSLSWHEMAAIGIGLAGGYWLVSRVLDGRDSPRDPERGREPPPRGEPTGGFGSSSGRSWYREESARPSASTAGGRAWWEVLGVPRDASRDEIALAYKRRISEYHPDKVAQMGEEIRALADSKSKEINAAYDEALKSL